MEAIFKTIIKWHIILSKACINRSCNIELGTANSNALTASTVWQRLQLPLPLVTCRIKTLLFMVLYICLWFVYIYYLAVSLICMFTSYAARSHSHSFGNGRYYVFLLFNYYVLSCRCCYTCGLPTCVKKKTKNVINGIPSWEVYIWFYL